MEELNQAIEDAEMELLLLRAEISTLSARKSMVECVREAFAQEQPINILKKKVRRKGTEITISEADYLRLMEQARSAQWVEQKLSELKQLGDRLWYQLNEKEALKATIRRAEEAELRCRRLEYELTQRQAEPVQDYDIEDGTDREIDYPQWDDREMD